MILRLDMLPRRFSVDDVADVDVTRAFKKTGETPLCVSQTGTLQTVYRVWKSKPLPPTMPPMAAGVTRRTGVGGVLVITLAYCPKVRAEQIAPQLFALGFIGRIECLPSRLSRRFHLVKKGIEVAARPSLRHVDRGVSRIGQLRHHASSAIPTVSCCVCPQARQRRRAHRTSGFRSSDGSMFPEYRIWASTFRSAIYRATTSAV